MRNGDENSNRWAIESLQTSLLGVCFGLFILLFLIAVDRPHWFQLKPMSGVANALSLASDRHVDTGARMETASRSR